MAAAATARSGADLGTGEPDILLTSAFGTIDAAVFSHTFS